MAPEIPWSLINQLQISLRKESQLPSFDPDDASLPPLHQLSDSIAEPDPSSPDLRCNRCKRTLLRGAQSLICVFCGKQQHSEEDSPINFTSSLGYRWFLHSLELDGSEVVRPKIEAKESSRGQNAPQDEIPLSELLNLEIRVQAEPEKLETSISDKDYFFPRKSSFNLAGRNVDSFVLEGKGNTLLATSEGQSARKPDINATGSDAFQDFRNLSLFENVQPSETALSSTTTEDKSGDLFSGWEADFQSADSRTHHEGSKSLDPFADSSKDHSANLNSVFIPGRELFDQKDKEIDSSNTNNYFQGGIKSNASSCQAEQLDVTVDMKDGRKIEDAIDSSSMNVGWIQDGQQQTSNNITDDCKTMDADDDSSDAWDDFKSPTGAEDASNASWEKTANDMKSMEMKDKSGGSIPSWESGFQSTVSKSQPKDSNLFDSFVGPSVDLSAHIDSVFGLGKDLFDGKKDDNMTSSGLNSNNWFQDDLVEKFDVIINADAGTVEYPNNSSSMKVDRIQDDQWPTSSSLAAGNKTISQDYDSFVDWNSFKGSSTLADASRNSSKETKYTRSTEEKSSDSFSGWDSDFQSTNSNSHNEKSKSFDDLSAQMDSVFGSGKVLIDRKAKDGSASASISNNWLESDFQTTNNQTSSGLIFEAEQFDVKDGGTINKASDSFSTKIDWSKDNQRQLGNMKAADHNTFEENEDSSDAWNDFTSSNGATDPSDRSSKQTISDAKPTSGNSEVNLFSMSMNSPNSHFSNLSEADFFPGGFTIQNGSEEVNIMPAESSLSNRMADASVRENKIAEVSKDVDFSNTTAGAKSGDMDTILSEMHDLSFMLENDLSIPPKVPRNGNKD
ncbi:hypothetical protein SLE2022_140600 [Rubroshorea leprosula]